MDIGLFDVVIKIAIPAASIFLPLFIGYKTIKKQNRMDLILQKEFERIEIIKSIITKYIIHVNRCFCYAQNKREFELGLEKSEMMGDTERFILEMNPEIEEENKLLSTIERFNDAFVFSKSSDYDVGRMWEVSKSIVAELGSYLNGKRDKINKGIIYKKEIAKNNNRERRRA